VRASRTLRKVGVLLPGDAKILPLDLEQLFSNLESNGIQLSFFKVDGPSNKVNFAGKLFEIVIQLETFLFRFSSKRELQRTKGSEITQIQARNFCDLSEISLCETVLNFVGEAYIKNLEFFPKIVTPSNLALNGGPFDGLLEFNLLKRNSVIGGGLRLSGGTRLATKVLNFKIMREKYASINVANLRATTIGLLELIVLNANLLAKFEPISSNDDSNRIQEIRVRTVFGYAFYCFGDFLLNKCKKLLQLDLVWRIEIKDLRKRDQSETIFIGPQKDGRDFCADPFIWESEGKAYCFFEYYDSELQLGKISYLCLDGDSRSTINDALSEDFHLSFPYIFDFEGMTYMCPETSSLNEIRLYRCVSFPDKWEYFRTLIDDIDAADTVIFEKNGLWWLLTNVDFTRRGIHTNFLNAYFATSPLSFEWTPHAQNPLIMDATAARNGGLFQDGDKTIRVGQMQGFNFYGKSASLYEILVISEESYSETTHGIPQIIQIQNRPGFHHLDVKKEVFAYDILLHRRHARAQL